MKTFFFLKIILFYKYIMNSVISTVPIINQISNKVGANHKNINALCVGVINGNKTFDVDDTGQSFNTAKSNFAITVVSSSTGDTAAGSGARTVKVRGIRWDGTNFVGNQCIFTMAGTSNASLTSGTNEFVFANEAEVVTSGTANRNSGIIQFKNSSNVCLTIPTALARSVTLSYAPEEFTRFIFQKLVINAYVAASAELNIWKYALDGGDRVFLGRVFVNSNTPFLEIPLNEIIPNGSFVLVEVVASVASASDHIGGFLEGAIVGL